MSWVWFVAALLAVWFVLGCVAVGVLNWWRRACNRLARRVAES